MIADIEKGLGRLPLMSSRESTDVKTRNISFKSMGGPLIFSRQGHPPGAAAPDLCNGLLIPTKVAVKKPYRKPLKNQRN
jgi:hypothetical protein